MSRTPQRFLSLMTKNQLAEMLAPTYALVANIDPNEAYTSLEPALKDVDLISALQGSIWTALEREKPGTPEAILDLVSKKLGKSRKFKAAKLTGKDEGAWVAMGLYLKLYAGVASGEAADLLETDAGQKLLERGFDLLGTHLAKELLR
jgi:hypothetical protein